MKIVNCTVVASALALFALSGAAHAQFGLPSIPGVHGKPSNAAAQKNGADASVSSDALVQSFVQSNKEILTAQSLLELAYGNKHQAALLQSESDKLKSSGVGQDQIKKVVDLSNSTSKDLAEKQAEKATFSAEEKKYYVQSLPHFAKGVIGTQKLVKVAAAFAEGSKSSMTGGGLMSLGAGMAKMKIGMYIAKATPGYSKNVFDTFRKTVAIGKSNKVKMPADATSALSNL
jgi:hypothetical protein